MEPQVHDVIVVGAGPAGMSAAVQLKRSGLDPLLLHCGEPGGLLFNADLVENYMGFPDGISGPELASRMVAQLDGHKVASREDRVTGIERTTSGYGITSGAEILKSRAVIIAAGTSPKSAGITGEEGLNAPQLLYEVAEIPREGLSGKSVVVIGGGDAAFDYSLNLSKAGARVTLVVRGGEPKCLPLLYQRASGTSDIHMVTGTRVLSLEKDGAGVRVEFEGPDEGECKDTPSSMTADHVLLATGREPNLKIIKGYSPPPGKGGIGPGGDVPLDMEPDGFPGLYLAGDVRWGRYRQASIAAADGVLAAMKAAEYLVSCDG